MKHLFIPREGDRERLLENVTRLSEYSDQKLIEAYHNAARCGIVGAHAQAIYLLALRRVMIERFGNSPITLEDGCIIDL